MKISAAVRGVGTIANPIAITAPAAAIRTTSPRGHVIPRQVLAHRMLTASAMAEPTD